MIEKIKRFVTLRSWEKATVKSEYLVVKHEDKRGISYHAYDTQQNYMGDFNLLRSERTGIGFGNLTIKKRPFLTRLLRSLHILVR